MFIRNRVDSDIKYCTGGDTLVFKAGTVTYIEDGLVSAERLRSIYGSRIQVVGDEATSGISVKKDEEVTDKALEEILSQVQVEMNPGAIDEIGEDKLTDEEAERLIQEALEDVETHCNEKTEVEVILEDTQAPVESEVEMNPESVEAEKKVSLKKGTRRTRKSSKK